MPVFQSLWAHLNSKAIVDAEIAVSGGVTITSLELPYCITSDGAQLVGLPIRYAGYIRKRVSSGSLDHCARHRAPVKQYLSHTPALINPTIYPALSFVLSQHTLSAFLRASCDCSDTL